MKMSALASAVLSTVLAVAPLAAEAHGPTRQKVTETVEIAAPPEKVWAVVGDFQDMSWHPRRPQLHRRERQRHRRDAQAGAGRGRRPDHR